jgi:hypothetical protein
MHIEAAGSDHKDIQPTIIQVMELKRVIVCWLATDYKSVPSIATILWVPVSYPWRCPCRL